MSQGRAVEQALYVNRYFNSLFMPHKGLITAKVAVQQSTMSVCLSVTKVEIHLKGFPANQSTF